MLKPGPAHPLSQLSHRLAPNKFKKTPLLNKAANYKKKKTMEPQFKGILGKKKKLNPHLSFSSCPSLTSSASYYCLASWLYSGSPSPLFLLLLLLSFSFYFFSSISMLDPRELTTLKATFVVHFLHLLSLSPEIFCILTYQAPPTWPILVHTFQIYSKSLMFSFSLLFLL